MNVNVMKYLGFLLLMVALNGVANEYAWSDGTWPIPDGYQVFLNQESPTSQLVVIDNSELLDVYAMKKKSTGSVLFFFSQGRAENEGLGNRVGCIRGAYVYELLHNDEIVYQISINPDYLVIYSGEARQFLEDFFGDC